MDQERDIILRNNSQIRELLEKTVSEDSVTVRILEEENSLKMRLLKEIAERGFPKAELQKETFEKDPLVLWLAEKMTEEPLRKAGLLEELLEITHVTGAAMNRTVENISLIRWLLEKAEAGLFPRGELLKKMRESNFLKEELVAKYTVKASVFTDLFSIPKNLRQLLRVLHPEDCEIDENSIHNVTIKNVLLDQCYNDLGFQVGDKLVILVEAQSTWTENIIIRSLMYLAQTYQEYIKETGQNVYNSKKIKLPKPELYVIYTGNRKAKPDHLYLSKEFFDGEESSVEIKVKMIYDGEEGDIINQYVTFTKIYDMQMKKYGRTREAVRETIRICKDRDILREYLTDREKEVENIMDMLFDDEYILDTYIESERREAAEKATQRAARKAQEAARKTAWKLHQKGISMEDIADILDVSVKDVEEWLELAPM